MGFIEERDMTDFLTGAAIGGGAAFALAVVLVLIAFTGWMDSGSH